MRNSYWREERLRRYEKMKEANDRDGLRRLRFGSYICFRRSTASTNLSQALAAEQAQITRIQWNRIENGRVLPRPGNIPNIAYTVGADPVYLFNLAGYSVPEEYSVYNRKSIHKRLDFALSSSKCLSEFLRYMTFAWREYEYEQAMVPLDVTFSYPESPTAYQEILTQIMGRLSPQDILKLVRELVRIVPRGTRGSGELNNMRFLDEIDKRLADLTY